DLSPRLGNLIINGDFEDHGALTRGGFLRSWDLFEEITLFANRTENATYEEMDDGKYKITIDVVCEKYRADAKGEETAVEVNDWIEIGAFAKPEDGGRYGATLFRERKRIQGEKSSFEFVTDELPDRVGIDPFALLIDRVPEDNMKKPSAK
ncbi:MAG: hypothetical protein AAGG44_18130, partial [Planctomycetota bacterium]